MSASFLEIVQLPNGDIALQRGDHEGEPLISISFSEESADYIGDAKLDIAKAMIQAGIQAVAQLELSAEEEQGFDDDGEPTAQPRLLH